MAVPVSGDSESKYMTTLLVFENGEQLEEIYSSNSSLSSITSFEPKAENIVPGCQEIKDKIRAALKLLILREPRVVVQFWSPQDVGEHQLLTAVDQPFGLGAFDAGLLLYRSRSEYNPFLVDEDHEEEDSGPPARVYMRGLPEWTPDLTNYMPKDFPLQECALACNLKGYIALPVFDSATAICVGVCELVMHSMCMDYAYEVQQIHMAFKKVNLTTPPVFELPTLNVLSERQNRMDIIHHILKLTCDTHALPLAQTWAVSPFSSYVACEEVLEKSCSSFNATCIRKTCMSTSSLPFIVRDLGMWNFREASKERHLEKSRAFVGKALLSHGSCFCADVSALSEEEYPLVHHARMSGLTSCFTIFLRDNGGDDDDDDEYVLEFFLPADVPVGICLLNLVETLEHQIEVTFGFELGVPTIEFVEPQGGGDNLSSDSDMESSDTDSSDFESNVATDTFMLEATFGELTMRFPFPVSSGLLELKNEVAHRVNFPGGRFTLKYLDDDNDLILIACDDDLQYLINCQEDDTTVNIIVELADD